MANSIGNMMGTGTPAAQASAIGGVVSTALTATGSTQGTALAVPSNINQFTTVAASTGAILPATAQPSDEYVIMNAGANALLVYPPSGASIGAGAANAGFSVAAGKSAYFFFVSPTVIGVILSA